MKVAELYRAALAEIAADEALLTISRHLLAADDDEVPGFDTPMPVWQQVEFTEAATRLL